MSASALLLTMALGAVGQSVPPELRTNQPRTIDPLLTAELRPAVEKASAAELDPRRGPGNAMEILKARRAELPELASKLQLDLRVAGVMLRSRFFNEPKLPAHERAARALSTYSRLDLTEPGLGPWLDRAIEGARPEVKKSFAAKDGRRLRVHVSAQGAGIDADKLFAELARAYEAVGVKLVKSSPKEADYLAKIAALEVRDDGGRALVRVTLDLAAGQGPDPRWKKALYRTAEATDAKVAVDAGVSWLARIGGRDLLFAWLDARGLDGALMTAPGGGDGHDHGDHAGHGHGAAPERAPIVGEQRDRPPAAPRVQISPHGGKQPAPPPSPSPKP